MQFSKNDALSLVRMMRTTLNEKFKKVDNSLKAVEEKMPYDLSGIADDFKFIALRSYQSYCSEKCQPIRHT